MDEVICRINGLLINQKYYLKCDLSSSSDSVYETSSDDKDEIPYTSLRKSELKVVKPLPMYLPSQGIKIANEFKFSKRSLTENHDNMMIQTYLNDMKLNENNIHLVYKMLLEIEDITCMTEYVPFVQKDVILNKADLAREYWIKLKDCPNIEDVVAPMIDEVVVVTKISSLSQIFPLKFKTDILLPHEHEEQYDDLAWRRIAVVRKIKKGCVYFSFSKGNDLSKGQIASLPKTKYDIIFRSPRYPLRYQHNAINLLGWDAQMRKYLFPTQKPLKDIPCLPKLNLHFINKTILTNPEQLLAVENIVGGPKPNAPFIIFGPPGTGKTTVLVESILQLFLNNPDSRLLITSGSNSACDTIALRICKYFDKRLCCQKPYSILRLYSKSIVEKGIKSIDPILLKYSNCDKGVHFYPAIETIHCYRILVSTLCTVGKLVTCNLQKNIFTHIFMDEAGASTIPEVLVSLMGVTSHTNCRLIVSGDHKQLGPIIKSERAAQLGLGKTLMEHLLKFDCYAMDDNCNYDCTLQARLRRNYRSHPEIVRLFNHLFYDDKLIASAKEEHVNLAAKWCKLPNPKFPIIFQAVHGNTEKEKVSPSSFNRLEIDVVMWFLRRLLNDGIDGRKVQQKDIGIITPYRLQNKYIQKRLEDRGWRNIESGSVETFQGREKQIIIVSLVKSFSSLGFVCNPKRLNVLLSRPQSLLILVGNPLTLQRNSNFAFVLDECKKHGTFMRRQKKR